MALKRLLWISLCFALLFHEHTAQIHGSYLWFLFGATLRIVQQNERQVCQARIQHARNDLATAKTELQICNANAASAEQACEAAIATAVSDAQAQHAVTAQAALAECTTNCDTRIAAAVQQATDTASALFDTRVQNCLDTNCATANDPAACRICFALTEAECAANAACALSGNLCGVV